MIGYFYILLTNKHWNLEKLKNCVVQKRVFFWYEKQHSNFFYKIIKISLKTKSKTLPVVKAGVHSCSPVAPQRSVKLFDGATVTKAAECKVVVFFLLKSDKLSILPTIDFSVNPNVQVDVCA